MRGLTTKLHVAVDRTGRLIRLLPTAGQRGDAPQAIPLLDSFDRGTVGCVVADAAYDSDAIRERARTMKARTCIRPNPTRKRKKGYDRRQYRNRNVIERFFGRIKRGRRVATRYEKRPSISPVSSGSPHSWSSWFECPYDLERLRDNSSAS